MNSIEQRAPYPQRNTSEVEQDLISEWKNTAKKRAFKDRFPKKDDSYTEALVKEYNNVNAPEDFVKCKDAILHIIGDESTKAFRTPSFESEALYLSTIKESVNKIERELGADSIHYKNICNEIVNTCLSLLVEIVWAKQTMQTIIEAKTRAEQLYTYYPISESTKERISETVLVFSKIEQEIQQEIERTRKEQQEREKASRLSERIKRFALSHSSVDGGDKRYTSPLLAWTALIVYGFGSIISLFEWLISPFVKKHDVES